MNAHHFFTRSLLKWNDQYNTREMPWKGEPDPYKIWLSEIILQQTRVEQGWDYYQRFITVFPTIQKLAKAPETKVFKMWEGLGYYSRCKNLIHTAKFISKNYAGKFPDQYEQLLALKGIGNYTAAAIASFAFNLPYAVIDGNVYRVLSRYFGISTAIDEPAGKQYFATLANELLDKQKPGIYNQAIMDLGAVICKPRNPDCADCPLNRHCVAFLQQTVHQLPVKAKRLERKQRWLYYFIIKHRGKIWVRKRGLGDIWENLYEFVLVETEKEYTPTAVWKLSAVKKIFGQLDPAKAAFSQKIRQQLTHQQIHGQFIEVHTNTPMTIKGYEQVSLKTIDKLPFPRLISGYLAENRI